MKLKKKFDLTISHKFPNSDIASVHFGTEIEQDGILDGADPKEIAEFGAALSKQVYTVTMNDMKRAAEKDKIIQEVMLGMKQAIKSANDMREAEKVLEYE